MLRTLPDRDFLLSLHWWGLGRDNFFPSSLSEKSLIQLLHHHPEHQDFHLGVWRWQRNPELFFVVDAVCDCLYISSPMSWLLLFSIFIYLYNCICVCMCVYHSVYMDMREKLMVIGSFLSGFKLGWSGLVARTFNHHTTYYVSEPGSKKPCNCFIFKIIWLFRMLYFSCRNFSVNVSFSAKSQRGFQYQLRWIYRLVW